MHSSLFYNFVQCNLDLVILVIPESFQSHSKVIPKSSQSHHKVISKSYKNHHKVITKSCIFYIKHWINLFTVHYFWSDYLAKLLLGSYYTYWSYKCFDTYFLDQPVRIFVNGGNFPTSTYNRKSSIVVKNPVRWIFSEIVQYL